MTRACHEDCPPGCADTCTAANEAAANQGPTGQTDLEKARAIRKQINAPTTADNMDRIIAAAIKVEREQTILWFEANMGFDPVMRDHLVARIRARGEP